MVVALCLRGFWQVLESADSLGAEEVLQIVSGLHEDYG